MWYFAWVLGVCLAALAAILNGMWLEMHLEDQAAAPPSPADKGERRQDQSG